MADRAVGGYSTASLDYVPAEPETKMPAHARFHGSISTKLPKDWRVQRTGTLVRMLLGGVVNWYMLMTVYLFRIRGV